MTTPNQPNQFSDGMGLPVNALTVFLAENIDGIGKLLLAFGISDLSGKDAVGTVGAPELGTLLWLLSCIAGAVPATSTPLSGTADSTSPADTLFNTNNVLIGPFQPQLGKFINVKFANLATGNAQVLRSFDATSAHAKPLTSGGLVTANYSADCQELGLFTESEGAASWWVSVPIGVFYRLWQ